MGIYNTSFKSLYKKTIEILKAQGIEFAVPERMFPQTEALIQQITTTGEGELDLNSDTPKKEDIVLIISNQHHPDFKKKDRIAYIGKVEDSSVESGRIFIRFQRGRGEGFVAPYEGWELLYSHFTPEEEHITHVHHGDIESATIEKGEKRNDLILRELLGPERIKKEEKSTDEEIWRLRAFRINQALFDTIKREVGPSAGSRQPFGWGMPNPVSLDTVDKREFVGELKNLNDDQKSKN